MTGKRPARIGVDIDGVMLDVIAPLLKVYNRRNGTRYAKNDITDYPLTRLFGSDSEARIKFVLDFFRTPEFRNIRPVPGAQRGIAALGKKAILISLTSRSVDAIEKETRNQILRYFPNAFSEIRFTSDLTSNSKGEGKAGVCRNMDIDIMIDDSFEYAATCAKQRVKVILLDCPWNREWNHGPLPQNVYRARNWPQIVRKVDELLT